MATLYEYFVRDGAQNLTLHQSYPITDKATGSKNGEFTARLHLDFDANAKYLSFYIPNMVGLVCPETIVLNEVATILKFLEAQVAVVAGFHGEERDAGELVFTTQIYLYSERPVPTELRERMNVEARAAGHRLTFRSVEYMSARNKWEKPRAFISHDSRDKKTIAEVLAVQMQKLMCPVWYDQFALKVGDSLRESNENGLKECAKCILVLTPNFLKNGGWTKREYDSIFTREIVEQRRVVLPVWDQVTAEDVYQYSPVLADRVAAQWSDGVEQVARKLLAAIDAPTV
jgi:TIR domain